MRYLKLCTLFILFILLVPILVACGGEGSGQREKPFTIGISNGFTASEWRTQMIEGMELVNQEFMDAGLTTELEVISAQTDEAGQIQQIRDLISRNVDAIIVNPNSIDALNDVLKQAKEAGILVISIDQAIPSADVVNVVIDQAEWAQKSARWLALQLNGQGNVVMINGADGHPANEARDQAAREIFAEYPGIEIVNEIHANWDEVQGQQMMADLLAANPDIDGVWVQDGMALGALQAIQAANPDQWPIVVGEARAGYIKLWNQIREERPDFVSYGVINPPGVGASGIRLAVELLQGRQVNDRFLEGAENNTIFVPIPGDVDANTFEQYYEDVKDRDDAYVLDGTLSPEQAAAYFD